MPVWTPASIPSPLVHTGPEHPSLRSPSPDPPLRVHTHTNTKKIKSSVALTVGPVVQDRWRVSCGAGRMQSGLWRSPEPLRLYSQERRRRRRLCERSRAERGHSHALLCASDWRRDAQAAAGGGGAPAACFDSQRGPEHTGLQHANVEASCGRKSRKWGRDPRGNRHASSDGFQREAITKLLFKILLDEVRSP